jgi:uncharacterized membrane protein (UPF0127 family)
MKTIKNPVLVGMLSAAAVLSFGITYLLTQHPNKRTDTTTISIEGKNYTVLRAKNAAEWSRGLMNVRHLDQADGMAFYFPRKATQTFWNMNTYMDLEIVWMDGDRVVGRSNLPSIEKSKNIVYVSSPEPANIVVELVKK